MNYTKEQQIERLCTEFCTAMCNATLATVESDAKLTMAEKKAFATGILCTVDGIKDMLLPALQSVVKENPRSFENLN